MWTLRRAVELDRETLADMYMVDYEDNYINALLFANDLLDNQSTILCFCETELAGVLCWNVRGLLEYGVCEITLLIVRPSFRRKSAGKQLVKEAISIARIHYAERGFQLRLVYYFMKETNKIADLFFKSIDFIRAAEIPSFYPNDAAIIWIKHLKKDK